MQKLLIVDDEVKIIEVLKEYAEFENYEVDGAENGIEAVEKCKNNRYDLVIMDIMMPKLDGFSAVREIRKFSQVPVIMLSARGEEEDKIKGFDLGIDDYVVKPFSPKEVMARVKAVLKRGAKPADVKQSRLLTFDGLVIDIPGRTVTVDGVPAELTPKEYELLFYMVKFRRILLY